MPYDPSKPANGAPIVSAELRSQFAALNDATENLAAIVASLPTVDGVNDAIVAQSANNINGLDDFALTVSNPPTQAEVQQIADKLSELITSLKRV